MTSLRDHHPFHIRRSVLCVPASNGRALAKAPALDCDAVIYDLEDAVLHDDKNSARKALVDLFAGQPAPAFERIIRINPLTTDVGQADLEAVLACNPDAVLLPKVESPQDIQDVADWLFENDAPERLRIWAMIETPRGVLNAAAIAEAGRTRGGRLDCFVVGLNDLRKETGLAARPGRAYCIPWLMQVLLAARSCGLDAIDAVFNDFSDDTGFDAECEQGRDMGFDGKMLIHPGQIGSANLHFGVSAEAVVQATQVIEAFARPENTNKGVISVDGQMIERLHLDQALRLTAKAASISQRKA
ncbi:HpcH/HpaI aldolase/citrate lyase family protein [Pararhizobium sp.]|uniref:HpcH/HpaI aldolase/citrate lyase family protein n=1 Tax=Pararhizobium sp. TaxID=1977563 RepID=UPI002720C895|nr:CoA ester lyase [Pararhizobium sp.]MDO9416615.1 CoA ester lyase [Pararhizobium sp.]